MTLLGKILTFLIFLFSIMFGMISVAVFDSRTNWHAEYQEQVTKVEEVQQQVAKLEEEKQQVINQAKIDLQTRDTQIAALQNDVKAAEALAAEYLDAKQTAETQLEKTVATLQEQEKNLTATREERNLLEQQKLEAEKARDEAVKKSIILQDTLDVTKDQVKDLDKRNKELAEQIAQKDEIIRNLQEYGVTEPASDMPKQLPPLRGYLKEVDQEFGLVLISVGGDDGVQKGWVMQVFRTGEDAQWLGKIEIVQVAEDEAVGRILPEFQKGAFKEFDHVATRILPE